MDLTQLEMFNAVALTGSWISALNVYSRESAPQLSPGTILRYSKQILALVDEAQNGRRG